MSSARQPEPAVAALESHLGYWLRLVSNGVSHAFARRLEALGVTVAEWVFLRALFDAEALAPTRLAGRMGMTKGAVSKLADRLVAKGLVARADDPADRRAHTLRLSPAGRALVPTLAAAADANDAAFFGALPPAERAALRALLEALAARHGLAAPPTG